MLSDEIERDLDFIMQAQPGAKLKLIAHPYLTAFLKQGLLRSQQVKWSRKYMQWIKIEANSDYHLKEYRFFDDQEEEIRLE